MLVMRAHLNACRASMVTTQGDIVVACIAHGSQLVSPPHSILPSVCIRSAHDIAEQAGRTQFLALKGPRGAISQACTSLALQSFISTSPKMRSLASAVLTGVPSSLLGPPMKAA